MVFESCTANGRSCSDSSSWLRMCEPAAMHCVCVCVCERERVKEKGLSEREGGGRGSNWRVVQSLASVKIAMYDLGYSLPTGCGV